MKFGITTKNFHLNKNFIGESCPTWVENHEINWTEVIAWNHNNSPSFAGRYFLCQDYKDADGNVHESFLWAHGEGAEVITSGASDLKFIVPIQQANPDRQRATGDYGSYYGRQDALAICNFLSKCIQMKELSMQKKHIYVFLEVLSETELSLDYWSFWSANVHDYFFLDTKEVSVGGKTVQVPTPLGSGNVFLPCICCKFSEDKSNKKYVLDPEVKKCLNEVAEGYPHMQTRCYGFWARYTEKTEYYVPEPDNLEWSSFEVYQQPVYGSKFVEVPVLLWRYVDENNEAVPESHKLTYDATHETSDSNDVSQFMLQIENWSTIHPPLSFGVDRGSDIRNQITCLANNAMCIPEMPATENNSGFHPNPPLKGITSFAIRYYSTRRGKQRTLKTMSTEEMQAIINAGAEVVVCWQSDVYDPESCGCGSPFFHIPPTLVVENQGVNDARDAFAYAANVGQPPYTPIYFAVDAEVVEADSTKFPRDEDDKFYYDHLGNISIRDKNGNSVKVLVPTINQIIEYFKDIKKGYLQYLKDQQDMGLEQVPYYVGVYASSNVLTACYILGLASYFWQAQPATWGDDPYNIDVWVHNNIWQIITWEFMLQRSPNFLNVNNAIRNCAGSGGVCLDVAWGDVGGWDRIDFHIWPGTIK
jgi:hypothetical protein